MMMGDVVAAPERRHGGDRDHQPAARRELRSQRDERTFVVRNMFQHVEQHDQVVTAVIQCHVGQVTALHRHAGTLRREGARMVVRLDGIDRPELLKHGDVRAGTAADFEYPERSLTGTPTFEQSREDLAPADEPPVIAVDLRHPVIDMAFHQASSSPVSPIVSRTM